MKTLVISLALICGLALTACQKSNSDEPKTDPIITDSTSIEVEKIQNLLENKFWTNASPPDDYTMGFRFSGDTTVTYSFISYLAPLRYDSVFDYYSILPPDTLMVFDEPSRQRQNSIGGIKIFTINDSVFTGSLLGYTDTITFRRIF